MNNISVDFSPGQLGIIKDIANIYNESLKSVIGDFYKPGSKNVIQETMDELSKGFGIEVRDITEPLEKTLHSDFFKHHDLKSRPEFIHQFTVMDLIILKFIAQEYAEDNSWNDLELANLIIKFELLIQNKSYDPESSMGIG